MGKKLSSIILNWMIIIELTILTSPLHKLAVSTEVISTIDLAGIINQIIELCLVEPTF